MARGNGSTTTFSLPTTGENRRYYPVSTGLVVKVSGSSVTVSSVSTDGRSVTLASAPANAAPVTVSCDVYRFKVKRRPPFVVKRALAKLRVTADWRAPPERAATEVAWIRLVGAIDPRWVPKILGEDRSRHLFVMEYLAPDKYPLWKSELAAGRADSDFAAQAGDALARIHAATAGKPDIEAAFANDGQFHAF